MHDTQTIPRWPGLGVPGRRAAFVAAVRAATARADWSAVVGALGAVPAHEMPATLIPEFLAAAMRLGNAELVAKAVRVGIEAEMPPMMRARLGWRLAFADHAEEAWMVLTTDPAVIAEPGAYAIIVQSLARVAGNGTASRMLRTAASALLRRYANRGPIRSEPAPHAFAAGPCEVRPGPGMAEVAAAPGTPALILDAYRAAIARFEAEIGTREAPRVRLLRDVFINRLGQVWRPDGTMLLDQGQPLRAASRDAMADAPCVPAGVFAAETHNSIYHWLVDWLPSLAWRFEPGALEVPILIRDDAAGFVTESLVMASGHGLPVLPVSDALRAEQLFIGSFGLNSVTPLGGHRRLLEAVAAAADAAPPSAGGRSERLYISRRDSPRRAMVNELALEEELARLGFRCVMFSPLTVTEKIRLMRDAAVIVSPHGAALGMLLYARPGTTVFELMPGSTTGANLQTCMARCSRIAGHRHRIWLEAANPTTGAWSVNLPAMLPDLIAFAEAAAPVR